MEEQKIVTIEESSDKNPKSGSDEIGGGKFIFKVDSLENGEYIICSDVGLFNENKVENDSENFKGAAAQVCKQTFREYI